MKKVLALYFIEVRAVRVTVDLELQAPLVAKQNEELPEMEPNRTTQHRERGREQKDKGQGTLLGLLDPAVPAPHTPVTGDPQSSPLV